ncbi:thiamine biosynthesis protein ThiI [Thermotomaculum hydrothermale]|uniref:Probable tRNA sulfurtransferase n=1 Tax=Thermotomaculum hydrothermale TaxID=981385 RepID=A0A7R6PQK9_9BACT|nr:tRNA uracil 4-sulfurtransferase ThiI [Thermotomaculum hydrothermale]BBB33516.1 thiamine biosynthesis protein ThiI [Thermotomaculum hydrothermale]
MNYVFIVRYGEIFIKGKNKRLFENRLIGNIKKALHRKEIPYKMKTMRGRIFVEGESLEILDILQNTPGIVSVSAGKKCNTDIEEIGKTALELFSLLDKKPESFKVETKRVDKSYPMTSIDISKRVAEFVLKNGIGIAVDVHNPKLKIGIELRKEGAYVFCITKKGIGGLPVGVSGKVVTMLSGGIDSPVASFLMQKRGCEIFPVYFHGFPFTSDMVKEKIIKLTEKLTRFQPEITLSIVNFTPVLKELKKKSPDKLIIILMRRFMVRVAEKLTEKYNCKAIVTGDNLGQVASQTLDNLQCITDASNNLILRPLLGFDKQEIISIARRIDTYNISIEPYEDCCSLFVPKFPEIYGKLNEVREAEQPFDIDDLVNKSIELTEVLKIGGKNG